MDVRFITGSRSRTYHKIVLTQLGARLSDERCNIDAIKDPVMHEKRPTSGRACKRCAERTFPW